MAVIKDILEHALRDYMRMMEAEERDYYIMDRNFGVINEFIQTMGQTIEEKVMDIDLNVSE